MTSRGKQPLVPKSMSLDDLINKFADYCDCDLYHYGVIDGRPGNHDPKDGHMEFDEEAFKQALLKWADEQRVDELKQPISLSLDVNYPHDFKEGRMVNQSPRKPFIDQYLAAHPQYTQKVAEKRYKRHLKKRTVTGNKQAIK